VVTQVFYSHKKHEEKNRCWGRYWQCRRPRNQAFWNALKVWLVWLYAASFVTLLIERPNALANNAVKVAARNDWEALLAGQVADEQQGSDEVSDVHVALTPEQAQ
jgi:hypothetical protein